MKKIIGIAPASLPGGPAESCMKDYYRLSNNYIKRAVEAGGTPVGLAPVDNWLTEEALDMCDAFLVQGGAEFYPYHFHDESILRGKAWMLLARNISFKQKDQPHSSDDIRAGKGRRVLHKEATIACTKEPLS